MRGTLFVVSTPIGNLGDASARAIDVLRRARIIACEDTRITSKLTRRFQIETPLTSYHEHNEAEKTPELLERLERGDDVALVSDAGTPLVSDPGYRLVRAARDAGIEIRAIPGPSAVLSALSVSGLPVLPFTFFGFLPPKGRARLRAIESLAAIHHTFVLYESPTRIARLLDELAQALGPRDAVLVREMTKLHEEHRAGALDELARWAEGRRFKGELTLVVSGVSRVSPAEPRGAPALADIELRFRELRDGGLSSREAAKVVAREFGVSSRLVYQEMATRATKSDPRSS